MNWDLTYLFKDEQEFEKAFNESKEMVQKLASFKGKLGCEEDFVAYLKLSKEAELKFSKVYLYSHLRSDLNKKDMTSAALFSRVMGLYQLYATSTSFEGPEILSLGKDKVMTFIDNNKDIEEFRFKMEKMFHSNDHFLDEKSEEIIAVMSEACGRSRELYSALSVADGKGVEVELSSGKVTVTQGNWRMLISGADNKEDRKKVFEAIFNYYEVHKNTYATIYEGAILANKAMAKNRKYDSILDSYLSPNNIPTSVYLNLVDVASNNNAGLKKYIKLREKYLGLDRHNTYDRFLELAKSDKKYSFEEAKEIFFASIKDCPQDFQDKAREALQDGFVDVMEKDGKRSGAYSSSVSDIHPFILLNFNGTLEDVFTLAHESGHSMHTLYSEESQPAMLQDYTIFVAEIASTFNEHMLLDYLMKSDKLDKSDKIMLLQKAIDEIYATFYRQTLFAEYELRANKMAEEDKPINHEVLSQIMIDLYKQYYDIDITPERVKQYVWAYIPHLFYTPFYVYQYATSFSASFKLYKNVKEGGKEAFDRYLGLLKAGGSKYPIDETRDAGVDFTNKETFMAVVERVDDLVNQLEKLLEEK